MEIKVNIPQNDYVQPTEVRQEIVQAICDGLLDGSIFHPFNEGVYRQRRIYVARKKSSGKSYFPCKKNDYDDTEYIRVRGVEVNAAFKALRSAGYHLFCLYEYGTWKGYKCSKKPFIEKGTEVFSFNDFID